MTTWRPGFKVSVEHRNRDVAVHCHSLREAKIVVKVVIRTLCYLRDEATRNLLNKRSGKAQAVPTARYHAAVEALINGKAKW